MIRDASIIGKTPEQWLQEIGFRQSKINEVIETFTSPSEIKVCSFAAPRTFFRFHETRTDLSPENYKKYGISRPKHWADASAFATAWERAEQFDGWLEDDAIARIAKANYRDICAICHNWNDMKDNQLWRLRLEGAERVEGLIGPTKPQPTHAETSEEPASRSMLNGGAIQAFLYPKTPFICTPISW